MSNEFFAECLCIAPGHECHGCKVNAYIYALKDRAEAAEAKLRAVEGLPVVFADIKVNQTVRVVLADELESALRGEK